MLPIPRSLEHMIVTVVTTIVIGSSVPKSMWRISTIGIAHKGIS